METGAAPRQIAFDRFVYDSADARLTGPDGPIRIGNKALGVLDALIAARGRLLTKDELFETVWDGTIVSESALTSVIKELRRALGDDRNDARFIESVYGRGYRFLPEVRDATATPPAIPRTVTAVQNAPATVAKPRRWLLPAALALLLIVVGAVAWRFIPRPATDADLALSSVAVLPFANISGNKDEDYFAAGVTEELRTRLSRLASLQVAARASSVSVKTSGLDAQTIGKRLAVGYVIDGSVRREGDIVRVSATLVDTRTGFQRWTQSYDRKLVDVFAIQGDIAQSVATEVQGRLGKTQAAVLDASLTSVPAAFDAYAKGRALFDLNADEATYRRALANFDQAIKLDPNYAIAYAQRARVLAVIANQYAAAKDLRSVYGEGLRSARKAVALSPQLPEAQAALGSLISTGSLDFAGASQPYESARNAGPNNADILVPYGLYSVRMGRSERGLLALKHASQLDPLNPRAFLALGIAQIMTEHYGGAIQSLRQALSLSPTLSSGHAWIGTALMMLGKNEAARQELLREPQDYLRQTGLAIVEQRLGNVANAQAAMQQLIAGSGDATAYQQAQVLAQLGNVNGAFAKLEIARKIGDAGLIGMKTDPLLKPLRNDLRFTRLLAQLDFPQ